MAFEKTSGKKTVSVFHRPVFDIPNLKYRITLLPYKFILFFYYIVFTAVKFYTNSCLYTNSLLEQRIRCSTHINVNIAHTREARLKGDLATYRTLNRARRSSLCHDKQVWADSPALEGEAHLAYNRPHDAFKNFRKLRSDSSKPSSIINDKNGEMERTFP